MTLHVVSPEGGSAAERRSIVAQGTYDEVAAHFEAQLWTDGLPCAPPTVASVERMLQHTERDHDESLGAVPPYLGEATVWSVAVNGVMAGCRPADMPILLA